MESLASQWIDFLLEKEGVHEIPRDSIVDEFLLCVWAQQGE